MAEFNPRLQPTNDPNYENRSRPIDIPDSIKPRGAEANTILPKGQEVGDKSAEYLGKAAGYAAESQGVSNKGFGDLFAGIVGVGDFMAKAGVSMVKKDIEDRVYDVANKERLAYTKELENIKAGKGVKNLLDSNAQMTDETPAEVEDLPNTLSGLKSASDSGKISKTDYYGRLLAAAKDMRSRYPGFREEIDAEFSKVTGVNPANAVITGLVQDINKAAASQSSERNRINSFLLQRQGYPNAQKTYAEFNAGIKTANDVLVWAAPYEREDQELKTRAARMNDTKLTRGERELQASRNVDVAFGMVVGRTVDTMLGKMGLNSAEDASMLDSQAKAGGIPAKRFEEVGQELAQHRAQLKVQMIRDADSTGVTKLIGKDEVNKRADASLSQLDTLTDRIYNKDFGGLYSAAKSIKAQTEDDTKDLLANSKVGPAMRQMMVLRETGGEQWFQKFNLENIKAGLPNMYSEYAKRWMQEITSQTNMRTSGMPVTYNDMLTEFKEKGMNDAKVNKSLVDTVAKIGDKDTPDGIKENIALAAFSPGNRGMISKLNADGVDSRGKQIQGMNAVFQKWTSPEVTSEMKRLGEKNPAIWKNYVDWTKETLGNELINREINDLKTIPETSNVKIGWDNDNSRFIAKDVRPQGLVEAQAGYHVTQQSNQYFKRVEASINRINSNLDNFKNVAKASGEDVNGFVLRTIADAGGREALSRVDGIPFQMLQQIGLMKLRSGIGSDKK